MTFTSAQVLFKNGNWTRSFPDKSSIRSQFLLSDSVKRIFISIAQVDNISFVYIKHGGAILSGILLI